MQKNFYQLLLKTFTSLSILLLYAAGARAQCAPAYGNGCSFGDDINSFTLIGANSTSFNQSNTGCTGGTVGYANYMSLTPVQMYVGLSYSGTINSTYSSDENVRFWIDFDNDNVFGATEAVGAVGPFGNTAVPYTLAIPPGAALGLHKMRVRCAYFTTPGTIDPCSNYSYGETHDYMVNILALAPCTGTPSAGTITGPSLVCTSTAFTLSNTGATSAGGITYQWQDSFVGAASFSNVAGATNLNYTNAAGITAVRYYRQRISCGANSSLTNIVTLTPAPCPCVPQYSNGCAFGDDINTITLTGANSTSINQPNTGCSGNGYADYTSLTPVQFLLGQTYNGTMNSSYFSTEYVRIWIDYNDNGIFVATEEVGTLTNIGTTLVPYTVSIPTTANPGIHRMRVRLVYNQSPSTTIDPCISYSYGETHDYLVQIISPLSLSSNSPACTGGNIVLTATTTQTNATFTFSGPGITTTSNTTGVLTIPNATSANAGTFSVTAVSGNTSNTATTVVSVTAPPVITAGSATAPTQCGGSNGSLTISGLGNSTAYTITYQRNNVTQTPLTGTSTNTGTYVMTGLQTGTYSNIVFTTTPGGCATTAAGPLLVPSPTTPAAPTATYNAPVCPGTTLTLTVSPTINGIYNWTGPTSYIATGAIATRANMTAADAGNYSVTVTTPDNCVSNPTVVAVVVNTPPAAPAPGNVSYCQFETAVPVTATGTSLKWYTTPTGGTGSTIAPTPNTSVAGNQTFYVTQTNAIGCEGPRAAVVITIKAKPAAPAPTGTGIFNYCQYEVVTAPLTAGGTGLKWYNTPTGGPALASAPVQVTNVAGTFNYYVSQTVNGCESDRLQVTAIVKPKPAAPQVQSPFNICQNDAPIPFPVQGQNLLWYETATGGTGTPIQPVANTGFEDSLTYYVSQTVNGCESDRALLLVVVNYRPNGTLTASKSYVCQEDTITFTYYGNARPDAVYNWVTPNPGTDIISGQNSQGPLVVRYNIAGNLYAKLTINNKGCLSPEITIPITVRPLPEAEFISKPDACIDEVVTVTLKEVTTGISNYSYDFAGGELVYTTSTGGPYGVKWSTAGTKVISLYATLNSCRTTRPFTDTIEVHDFPVASIEGIPDNIQVCSNDSVMLRAQEGFDVVENTVIPYKYMWTPVQFFGNNEERASRPVTYANVKITTPIVLTVTNNWGCVATDTAVIVAKPCCDVIMPDAFSPNGDGRNDIFRPLSKADQNVVTFRVLNRWGQVVFETKDAFQQGWNGTMKGEAAPMETYFYFLRYQCSDGKFYDKSGEILLLR